MSLSPHSPAPSGSSKASSAATCSGEVAASPADRSLASACCRCSSNATRARSAPARSPPPSRRARSARSGGTLRAPSIHRWSRPTWSSSGKLFDGLELKLLRGTGSEVLEYLKQGEVELGIAATRSATNGSGSTVGLCSPRIFSSSVNSMHSFADRPSIAADDQRQERLMVRTYCETTRGIARSSTGTGVRCGRDSTR